MAERFAQEFYGVLNEAPGEYDRAFTQGKLAVHLLQEAKWADGAQKPFGLPCFLCLSSEGNVLCTRSSIMPSEEEEEERARMESAAAASVMGDEDDTSDGVGEPAWSEGEDPGACLPSRQEGGHRVGEAAQEHEQTGSAARPARARDSDAGENRSLNNPKGESELAAFKALGFVLDYNRYSIEAGIRKHGNGQLAACEVGRYGLQEKVHRGRKLLYLSRAATRQVFGCNALTGYTDRQLWAKGGAIYRQAAAAELPKLDKAIGCLEQSLARRGAGGDAGHDFMRERIAECVDALKSCARERRAGGARS